MRPRPPTVAELGEIRLVRVLRRTLDRPGACSVANGDDALVWQPQGQVVATVDSVVEGVDWLAEVAPPEAVGHRAAAVNLSDLAAMGAEPKLLLLALECRGDVSSEWLLRAARGLAATADRFGCSVAGGDVGLCPGPQRWSVTALGQLQGPPLLRSTARPGDRVWLIGRVGWAALGLAWLQRHPHEPPADHWAAPFVRAHWWPEPLVAAGRHLQALAQGGARISCLDVSDGLALDAARLAEASRVGIHLQLAAPAWPAEALDWLKTQELSPAELVGAGGDDYALLVAAPADLDLAAAWPWPELPCTAIGEITVGPAGKAFVAVGNQVVQGAGWLHGT
ncbi:MAG: thiamine-phosphate kinase [Deltaproteobacteria bacterium]|nr:thiamine-phosphate kinase [Deltaproteobacteria bacterium]